MTKEGIGGYAKRAVMSGALAGVLALTGCGGEDQPPKEQSPNISLQQGKETKASIDGSWQKLSNLAMQVGSQQEAAGHPRSTVVAPFISTMGAEGDCKEASIQTGYRVAEYKVCTGAVTRTSLTIIPGIVNKGGASFETGRTTVSVENQTVQGESGIVASYEELKSDGTRASRGVDSSEPPQNWNTMAGNIKTMEANATQLICAAAPRDVPDCPA